MALWFNNLIMTVKNLNKGNNYTEAEQVTPNSGPFQPNALNGSETHTLCDSNDKVMTLTSTQT